MKKEYISPEAAAVLTSSEQALLSGSVYVDSPVPDALVGDTDSWGEWI